MWPMKAQTMSQRLQNPHFYSRVMHQGSYGLGESYVDGWWDCAQLDEFFYRILIAGLGEDEKSTC
jgi:cyclopropane-fatty-acyl-phospholipid synthase